MSRRSASGRESKRSRVMVMIVLHGRAVVPSNHSLVVITVTNQASFLARIVHRLIKANHLSGKLFSFKKKHGTLTDTRRLLCLFVFATRVVCCIVHWKHPRDDDDSGYWILLPPELQFR